MRHPWIFYAKMFGGEVAARLELPHLKMVRMNVGGVILSLSPLPDGVEVPASGAGAQWGMYELGFEVEDTYKAVEELKAKGAEFIKETFEVRPGVQVAFMKALDGVQIEILHRD